MRSAAPMPSSQEVIDLKQPQLRLVSESNCLQEERILPSGSDAAVMWVHGLGSTQTTPSTSAQAVPAPIVDRSTPLSTLIAWLQLTNQVLERPYDC
jgi:hypothetical protein